MRLRPHHPRRPRFQRGVLVDRGAARFGLLWDGDVVRIGLGERRLDAALTDAELAARREGWQAPEPRYTRGWLGRYARLVGNASSGAVLA